MAWPFASSKFGRLLVKTRSANACEFVELAVPVWYTTDLASLNENVPTGL